MHFYRFKHLGIQKLKTLTGSIQNPKPKVGEFGKGEKGKYRPDVGGDNDDDGERAEPGVSDGEGDVARDLRAGEVAERDQDHPQGQGQRDQVEHPHLLTPENDVVTLKTGQDSATRSLRILGSHRGLVSVAGKKKTKKN